MNSLFHNLIPVVIGVLLIVLAFGFWNMLRGGSGNLSQKLMRWRVGLQLLAICIVMAAIYFAS